jgi:SAM-dependent methyltransferase
MPTRFDQFAADYRELLDRSVALSGENSAYFAEYKARYLSRILGPDFAGRVLDFGCGVGLLSGFLRKYLPAARLDGYDLSSESIARIDPALARQGTFTSDLANLPGAYELIVVANVMHHVPPGRRRDTFLEFNRLLAPGGRLALFEHNSLNPLTRWAVNQCAFDDDAILLPAREALGYFRSADLEVERRDYIVFVPRWFAWLRPVEPCLRWLPLGAQYVIVGDKMGPSRNRKHS